MPSYKITKVSTQEPRVWDNPKGGKIYYIKVAVDGWEKPIEVGKKSPDALKVGDELHGTITATEYPNDKFKADPPAFSGGGKSNYVPRDDDAIRAQWAIGQAIQFHIHHPKEDGTMSLDIIEPYAIELYAMVERVKGSNTQTDKQNEEPRYEDPGF